MLLTYGCLQPLTTSSHVSSCNHLALASSGPLALQAALLVYERCQRVQTSQGKTQ